MSTPSKRLEWMVTKIKLCFPDAPAEAVDKLVQGNAKKFDAFLEDASSPVKLFIFYQPRQFKKPELFLSLVGDGEKLTGKALYFLRNTNGKPVKTAISNDTTVLSGELNSELLQGFQSTVAQLYGPVLEKTDRWGHISRAEEKEVFLNQVSEFNDDLAKKIANLKGDVEIRMPSDPYDKIEQKPAAYARAAKEPPVLAHFSEILLSWCDSIKKYMDNDPSNTPLARTNNEGPEVEIEYWTRRLLSLISVTEQLKSKSARVVTGVLKARALRGEEEGAQSPEALAEQEEMKNNIEYWREVDLAITDSLNEAKDNVRFLENVRTVVKPLQTDKPSAIADLMPSLMNSMKMIHTLSRHYGTTTRMTNLFQRITNQLITRCKEEIYQKGSVSNLWNADPAHAMEVMKSSIALLEKYKAEYHDTKHKLSQMPKGKQFNFDESLIFGKFELFRLRLQKVLDIFSSIEQFSMLKARRIDGMEKLIGNFESLVTEFRSKGHDLLDFYSTAFERDYVEFTMHNSGLENAIVDFMGNSLLEMSNIEKQLLLLENFKHVLKRESLRKELENKYKDVFRAYSDDLQSIQQQYEKSKENPPIQRNMTRIAGNISWSRQMLRRITKPMKMFQENKFVFNPKDSKKNVKQYNKLAKILIEYEQLWFRAFKQSCDTAKKGLRGRLIVKDAKGELHVNFDVGVLQMMREAKALAIMGFNIPQAAQRVMIFEDKLKSYHEELSFLLKKRKRILGEIGNVAKSLLKPHLKNLNVVISPAITIMTWTSMNVSQFIEVFKKELNNFEDLINQTNNITNNRIQLNLDRVMNMSFIDCPKNKTYTLKDFKDAQMAQIEKCTKLLQEKNTEIERAVDDLIHTITSFDIGEQQKVDQLDINFVKLHYSHALYHGILCATKGTLDALRNRIASQGGFSSQPLFELDLSLQDPEVVVLPNLQEVTEIVQAVAREILGSTKQLMDWGVTTTGRPRSAVPFYNKLAGDKRIAVSCILLSGSLLQSKKRATEALGNYNEYKWLWAKDPEQTYKEFSAKKPILEDFVVELQSFANLQDKVKQIAPRMGVGSLTFKTEKFKSQLTSECSRWTFQYSEKLHQEAKADMEKTIDLMANLKNKLERETKDFINVKIVMDSMAEIREVSSWIQAQFNSITQTYNMLENFLPHGAMSKDEMDAKSVLNKQWKSILLQSEQVMTVVNQVAPGYKKDLIEQVGVFKVDVENFKLEYDACGPMVPGTKPKEAIARLKQTKREFDSLYRKYETYHGGEKLFGLPQMEYEVLVTTKKELSLLDRLYSLYEKVISTIDEYKQIPWTEVVANIQSMNDHVESFNAQCKKLPKSLRGWDAYVELTQTVNDFIDVLPLLMELSKPSMRDRHWQTISELCSAHAKGVHDQRVKDGLEDASKEPPTYEFDINTFHELKLASILEAPLLECREDIEEITDGADKQLAIENKLEEIAVIWAETFFDFNTWKERGDVILMGSVVNDVIEKLEESQSALVQMLTQRNVKPFKELATSWLKKLSDVSDVLEGWTKVQMLWMSLEAVFTGGDIARQMPQDTRVFMKVDKEWTTRLMAKAKEVRNVLECCQNDYIKTMLPTMFVDLEKCQKALDGYLEAKRAKFPRFYFVSNPALLLILSQGSDKEAVQDAFPKCFDAIDRVTFEGNNIVSIQGLSGGYGGKMDKEEISLAKPVAAKGNIEDWLLVLLKEMMNTVNNIVKDASMEFESMPVLDFIAKYPGQVALIGIQLLWTNDVQEACIRCKNDKASIPNALKNQQRVLAELSQLTTTEIPTKMERTKVETLVTIQVHQVDVTKEISNRFKEKKLKDPSDFEWQKQLRIYWVPEKNDLVIKCADVDFSYCGEYLGCKERLVITPLTDRCYISLTQAVGMCFGGAPAGPAGTGKTETTKDLGRALGKYVVVFNCSDQMHTADTAKLYKGLCQSGSWGCFDEFNRIDLEVLSVVAQQVEAILRCLRARGSKFSFPGDDIGPITVDTRCGFFITMNPGYAGRQELPENLKALFRSCAMMVPDREIIMKVKLASVGYSDYGPLSKKFAILYRLSEEQLSKQRHYDFGLRNILSVLRTAGVNLRIELKKDTGRDRSDTEEMLLMRTLRDMNLAKLVADDVGLFISLLHDLFPNQEDPEKRRYDEEEEAMKKIIKDWKLIQHESWVAKIIQLYETSLVRHGLMMVGPAGGGKTEGTKVLVEALSQVKGKAAIVRMNPKAILSQEMFGQNDLVSGEWTHGIFSSIWAKYNDPKKSTTWIVCDGPVDAIWIENLNTVLDDNKLLTLANGDRLPMTDNVRILFEVQDLRNASPATVSRAGIVFVSANDLGYEPIVESWMNTRDQNEAVTLRELYSKYLVEPDTFDWLMKNTQNVMITSEAHLMTNFLQVIRGLLKKSNDEQNILPPEIIERYFIYGLCWSLGSLLEADDRKKFSDYLCEIAGDNVPAFAEDTNLYEYFVDPATNEFKLWTAPEYIYDGDTFNFATALIPTMDSCRTEFLIKLLAETCKVPVLICGSSGTAKTSIVQQYCNTFDPTKQILKNVNFSSATTAGMFQRSMEADIEKRQGKTYAPSGGRAMTVFLDDVSMPEVNNWGDQPTLEIVRQIIEEKGIMFLEKDRRGEKMDIENVTYIGAMNQPGGGRNDIPNRLKRHFFTINCTPPSRASIDNIYGTMLRGHFEENPEQLNLVDSLTKGTIELWLRVKQKMLPTPAKFHYIFNMRDLSRIFQGILFVDPESTSVTEGDILLRLWLHECERVLCDKLVSNIDKEWYKDAAWKVAKQYFGEENINPIQEQQNPVYFVDFLRKDVIDPENDEILELAPKIYELADFDGAEGSEQSLSGFKNMVEGFLQKHNGTPGNRVMDLVLFTDALEHMLRISRIIGLPRGNALLVGVGGSGRQSLTRLAAFIARHEVFQVKLTRTYKVVDFLDDIRRMYTVVGKEGKKLTWIFTDFEIIYEDFLEYINAILATGEVAGLFPKDERDMMCADLRGPAKQELGNDFDDTPDNLYKYFLDRIRSNLHIVLVFSPANEKFAERARKFPALIGCCTIDWFLRWPEQALVDVSAKFIKGDEKFKVDVDDPKAEQALVSHIAAVHNLVTEGCDEYFQMYRRAVFVTPKSYLAFIAGYKSVYTEKLETISRQERNVKTGLIKLAEAETGVDAMKVDLAKQQIDLQEAEKAANIMLKKVEAGKKEANVEKDAANIIAEKCKVTADQIATEKEAANKLLEGAMPFVHAATDAAKSINKKDVGIITKLGKPPDLIKRIMDCVLILFSKKLVPVSLMEINTSKDSSQMFIKDSYDEYAKSMMNQSDFVTNVMDFAMDEPEDEETKAQHKGAGGKDRINDETIELLAPYLAVKDFNADRASQVANAAKGLCLWVSAMNSFQAAAKVCKPLLEQLNVKEALLEQAMAKLKEAEGKVDVAQAAVDKLNAQFNDTMAEKNRLKEEAELTERSMTSANQLINSLSGEKIRWTADAKTFSDSKRRLVGDVALSCAFVSYLGPFNQVYRKKLLEDVFYKDAIVKGIPITKDLQVTSFLVDDAVVAAWNSQGLPKDDLSIQNGILVTQASRYPLLVDPQSQAFNWLKKREAENFPHFGTTTLSNPKLRDCLEFSMEEGKTLLVEGITKDIDPMFDPVLEKIYTIKGRTKYVLLGDKMVSVDKNFKLFFITKLGNPTFSPELSAKTTIIDFSVTQKGLEDQLLARVIMFEQASLEEQRQKLVEEVNANTIALAALDKELLDRLSNSKGNLLKNIELINVLNNTKIASKEVGEKIAASKETEVVINQKREQYRPVARRASIVYFVIVALPGINVMYQFSLKQFLEWFDFSIEASDKANLVAKRVEILIEYLTFKIYQNANRGLFECDKLTFKLMIVMQVYLTESPDKLNSNMVNLLLRGGSALAADQVPRKPFEWMSQKAWINCVQLALSLEFFGDLKNTIESNVADWKKWYEAEGPEHLEVPNLEERLQSHPMGPYMRMLIVRSLRDDRFSIAAGDYISASFGKRYTDPETIRFEEIWADASRFTPVVLLLTPGADPTTTLQELAKKKSAKINAVSMGEGQEKYAKRAIKSGMQEGNWALLQNCHLGLGFMAEIETIIGDAMNADAESGDGSEVEKVDENFRLWITCEPHVDFPINLLQMSIKVTSEPPAGMKAGLYRSYTTVVDDERLNRVEEKDWRLMVYSICFLHSTVQERRKFGAVGWCIPYEFNAGDLEASLTFTEKHFFATGGALNWYTIQYMICEVQYGGRITDDLDRVLFNTFGTEWLNPSLLEEEFSFCEAAFNYSIPDKETCNATLEFITQFPSHDTPEIFGLHTNADLTYGTSETDRILGTINDTQPKSAGGGGGKTKEEIVFEKADELLQLTPPSYKDNLVRDQIRKRSKAENEFVLGHRVEERVDGFTIPLNVFLYQEIVRCSAAINRVYTTFTELKQAINGEIIMTPELQAALASIYDNKPPRAWYIDASGAEIAWSAPSLAIWFDGLLKRNEQLHAWLNGTRPLTYWLTGFFNPQGFLTAARQEMTRRQAANKWALDDVVLRTDVTDHFDLRKIKEPLSEGFFIQGLFLEGASWERSTKMIKESAPKELFTPMPVLKITALTNEGAAKHYSKGRFYECPCYTKKRRTDLAFIYSVKLPTAVEPEHWTLRGVALLASTD